MFGKKDSWAFILFLIGILILYYPTHQAGFVTDFYGWQDKFDNGSITGILTTFGWHANQQVAMIFFYTLYCLFGINGWGWFICFSALHALNGFIAFKFFRRLFEKFSLRNAAISAFIGSLLFLFSPYQAEVLVWRVCIHYLVVTLFLLLILWETLNYLEEKRSKFLWRIHMLFFLSLFTLEIALIIPLLLVVLVLIWNTTFEKEKRDREGLGRLIFPQFALIGLFFLANKLILSEWVGHYGAATHFNISLHDVFSNYFRYFIKYLVFARYFDHPVKMKIFSIAENSFGIEALLTFFITGFFASLIFYKRLSNRLRAAGLSLLFFFISLTPIVTLYMVTLLYGENDRYGYPASIFFWMTISVLLAWLPKGIFYSLSVLLVGVSIFLLLKTTQWWNEGNSVYYGLLNDFRWYDKEEVIILNIPDNYHGLYMFRIYGEPSGLKEGLELIRKKPYAGEMHEVTQFNMMTPNDGVSVKKDSTGNLTVTFNQWGNWWWWEGIGNSDFENDSYSVHFDGSSYHIHFKTLKSNHAIIYQVGDKWREVEW